MASLSSLIEPPINALAIGTEEWFHSEWLRGQRPPFWGNGTPIQPYRISLVNIKKEALSSPQIEFLTLSF